MTKDGIPRNRLGNNILVGGQDIVARGWRVTSVIQEKRNVAFLKAMDVHNVLLHVHDIVVATTQLTGIVT